MGLKAIAQHAPVIFSRHWTAGEAADSHIFTADRGYELLEVNEVHRVAGAGSTTLMIEKAPSGTAPGSGTDLLGTAFATDSTADTPVHKTAAGGGLVASKVSRTLARGDSLVADFTGTMTAYEGGVTIVLRPLGSRKLAY